MSFYELINKKKRGGELTREEIRFTVTGFTCGEIPDYQMSAFLMAVYFRGMTAAETAELTMAMAESGEQINLAAIREKFGTTSDKHSTGGVGDKTTLVVVPIVAACGVPVAKMSGRGLGHTGGTADKLEAIPGLRLDLHGDEFMQIVEKHGACIATQSANLAPADKKIYALRDITATVDSLPLIAASVMSKKIAAGADSILLDVKAGSGAFMKTPEDARALAQAMVDIGTACGRKTAALITNMDAPLGYTIGNSLEIIEVVQILSGKIPAAALPVSQNLITLCEELSAAMLLIAGKGDGNLEECRAMVKHAISSGAALKKLANILEAQGGDVSFIEKVIACNEGAFTNLCTNSACHAEINLSQNATFLNGDCALGSRNIFYKRIPSPQSGYIAAFDTEAVGLAAMALGAGRVRAGDDIDPHAGIILRHKVGDFVEKGHELCCFATSSQKLADNAAEKFLAAITFSEKPPALQPLIFDTIGI